MRYVVHDKKYSFKFAFDTETGAYVRTGVLDENGKDTGIDHRLAVDPESVGFAGGNVLCGNREVGIDVLLGQDGLAGSDSSYHGERDHLGADHLEAVVTDLDRPGLCGIPADIAVLFQSLQMGMDGRSGTEIDRRTDLAY